MPAIADLTGLFVNYEQTVVDDFVVVHTDNNENMTPPDLTDDKDVVWQSFIEFDESDSHWKVHIEANGPIWGTDHLVYDAGPDFPPTFGADLDAFNGRNGTVWVSGTGNFIATFALHSCECILNTLHCAGLTLAGLCGSDKHTAAVILGTAGGIQKSPAKTEAAQANGLLGGWYSWH